MKLILNRDDEITTVYTISELIIYVTLSYYYMSEYFELYPKFIEASGNQKVITRAGSSSWDNVCYGAKTIDPAQNGSYRWDIKLESYDGGMMIGIGSDYESVDVLHLLHTKSAYYVLNCYFGGLLQIGDKGLRGREYLGQKTLKKGDTIGLDVNCDGDNSYIKYYVNDVDKGIAFTANEIEMDDNITYRMAVSLHLPTDCVRITDFKYVSLK